MASYAKFQGVHKSARLAALQITGLSVAHLPLVLNGAAFACGLSGARYMEIRYILALHPSYMFCGGLRDTFQCVPPSLTYFCIVCPRVPAGPAGFRPTRTLAREIPCP